LGKILAGNLFARKIWRKKFWREKIWREKFWREDFLRDHKLSLKPVSILTFEVDFLQTLESTSLWICKSTAQNNTRD
jgi:hypothetical protein